MELEFGQPIGGDPLSKVATSSLFVEWSPDGVRVWNAESGRIAEGRNLDAVAGSLAGHRNAIVGVARTHCFTKRIPLPKANSEDLRRLLQVQIGQHSPLPADQVSFDFVATGEPLGDGYAVLLCMMRTGDLRQLRDALAKAGLRAERVLPIALAAAPALISTGRQSGLVIDRWLGSPTHDIVTAGRWIYGRTCDPSELETRELARTWAAVGEAPSDELVRADSPEGGLLIRHLAQSPAISLEPAEERVARERKRRVGRTRFGVLMALASVLLIGYVWDERDRNEAVLRRGEGVWARQLGQLRSIRRTEQGKATEATKVRTTLDRAFTPAQSPVDLVNVVTSQLPDGLWLTGFAAERGKSVQVRGTARRAEEVAVLVDRLSASPRFRDVRLLFANGSKIDETPVVQFSITATAVGNLPLPEPDKAARKGRSTASKGARS